MEIKMFCQGPAVSLSLYLEVTGAKQGAKSPVLTLTMFSLCGAMYPV